MALENLEIIEGEGVRGSLKSDELEQLADNWMKDLYPDEPTISGYEKVVERLVQRVPVEGIRSVLSGVRERFRHLFPQHQQLREFQENREKFRLALMEQLNQIIESGDMLIARENGKTVGMIKVSKLDSVGKSSQYAGKEIYEIGKASVLPEARGKGVYRKLRERVVEHIKAKHGDVHILCSTKNAAVKKVSREMGWREIGYLEYLRIQGQTEESIESQNAPDGYIQKEGWTAFMYEPKEGENG